MVLTNNKVDVIGQSNRTSSTRLSSATSNKSPTFSFLSDSDKVKINDELLNKIISNNMENINETDHKMIKSNAYEIKLPTYLKKSRGYRVNTAGKIPINNIGDESDTKKMADNVNSQKEMTKMIDSNYIAMLSTYFNYSSIVSHAIKDYFEGTVRGKLGSETIFYDNILLYFSYLFCARNLLLAFIEDIELRTWLGEVERIRPYRQLVMVQTIWSFYVVAVLRNFRPDSVKKQPLSWLQPFRVLRGESTPKSFGLSEPMLNSWFHYTVSMWRFYFGFAATIFVLFSLQILGILRHRWNGYYDKEANNWYNMMQLFWAVMQIYWIFFTITHTYVCTAYFNSLCYYFRIRYEKVNEDIEIIINKRLKANERVALLHHILVEHNSLCLKVSEYNRFWANHLMSTYFFLISVVCFSSFQAFFTANMIVVRLYMFLMALLAGFIITRISVSASIMSNRAHEPYGRLIRVTFEKYPVELQIQLRMFIQRTSGPTIGFYCLDVFEITYTTYASILAALGQNFLLIVDFVRSYAEVGKEYEEISFSDFNLLTGTVLNSTLDVLDEMTGSHLSSTLHSNTSFISF